MGYDGELGSRELLMRETLRETFLSTFVPLLAKHNDLTMEKERS